jgi:hypothetical protein
MVGCECSAGDWWNHIPDIPCNADAPEYLYVTWRGTCRPTGFAGWPKPDGPEELVRHGLPAKFA